MNLSRRMGRILGWFPFVAALGLVHCVTDELGATKNQIATDAGADTGDVSDAPRDGDLPKLACDSVQLKTPTLLQPLAFVDAGGSNKLFSDIFVAPAGKQARIVVASNNTFSIFTVDPDNASQVTRIGAPSGFSYVRAKQVPGGGMAILATQFIVGTPNAQFVVFELGANDTALPAPVIVTPPFPGNTQYRASFTPIGPKDYLVARVIGNATPFSVEMGRATNGPAVLKKVRNAQQQEDLDVYAFGNNGLLVQGTDPAKGGTVYNSFALSADFATLPAPKAALTGRTGILFGVGVGSTNDKVALSVADIDLQGTVDPFVFKTGEIAVAKLADSLGNDLPKTIAFTRVADLPIGGRGGAEWFGEDYGAIGPGESSDPGVNFVWLNRKGEVRANQTGPGKRILTDRKDLLRSGVAKASALSPVFVTWHVAWLEGSDLTQNAYYNVLRCQAAN